MEKDVGIITLKIAPNYKIVFRAGFFLLWLNGSGNKIK